MFQVRFLAERPEFDRLYWLPRAGCTVKTEGGGALTEKAQGYHTWDNGVVKKKKIKITSQLMMDGFMSSFCKLCLSGSS